MKLRTRLEDRALHSLQCYDGPLYMAPRDAVESVRFRDSLFSVQAYRDGWGGFHWRYFVDGTPRLADDFDTLAEDYLSQTLEPQA